jgi:hypothetical protein
MQGYEVIVERRDQEPTERQRARAPEAPDVVVREGAVPLGEPDDPRRMSSENAESHRDQGSS